MSTPELEQQSLVLRHLAGFMKHGMSLDEALAIFIDGLPPGETRESLVGFRTSLHRGAPSAVTNDPFLTLLMRAEAVGPEAITLAADSFDSLTLSEQAEETGFHSLIAMLGVLAFATNILAWAVVPLLREGFSVMYMPAATLLTMGQLQGMAVVSIVVLALALLLRGRLQQHMPGASGLQAASRLRLYGAALRSGVDDETALLWSRSPHSATGFGASPFGLTARETVLLDLLSREEGRAEAAEAVALERETAARRQYRRWLTSAPSLIGFIILWAVAGSLIGLYLPIFKLAGAIQ